MIGQAGSSPAVFGLLLLIMCSFAQVAIGNAGSCQMYGHSCLGGHGKRSVSPPVVAGPVDGAGAGLQQLAMGVYGGSGEEPALPPELQSQLALRERLEALSGALAKHLKRVDQYRTWKRYEPVLAELRRRSADAYDSEQVAT